MPNVKTLSASLEMLDLNLGVVGTLVPAPGFLGIIPRWYFFPVAVLGWLEVVLREKS